MASPKKMWLSGSIEPMLRRYKGDIAETKDSEALRQLILLGLSASDDGFYGKVLQQKRMGLKHLTPYNLRISPSLVMQVKAYGGRNGLDLYQAYFSLVCRGLHLHLQLTDRDHGGDFSLCVFDQPPWQIFCAEVAHPESLGRREI